MAGRMTTEAALAAVAELANTDPAVNVEAELRRLLQHRSNFVVGKAAALAEARRYSALAAELIKSFLYFVDDGLKRDPGCSAKLAIANALLSFSEPAWDVYLAGVRHVQKEPAWGEPIDTAATLRGICGRALFALGHHDAFRWHALLIADPEPMTRALAVETLSGVPDERAELLLRTKIVREPHPDPLARPEGAREPDLNVEMDAFDGLMKIAPDESLDFVAGYLYDNDRDRMRGAALALGASRRPEAFAALRERWGQVGERGMREALALPIALIRSDEAFSFLLEELRSAPTDLATALVEALALFRETPARAAAVQEAVERRDSRPLAQAYRKHFTDAAVADSGWAT